MAMAADSQAFAETGLVSSIACVQISQQERWYEIDLVERVRLYSVPGHVTTTANLHGLQRVLRWIQRRFFHSKSSS